MLPDRRRTSRTEMTIQLNLEEAVALAHGLVSHQAQQHGIRVLFIKGPVAEHFELRPQRQSTDVDVLVDPEKLDSLVAILKNMGWYKRPMVERPRILDQHSVTLIHDKWPCDIDLHLSFPGFLEKSQAVFEYLWNERELAPVAANLVPCPSLISAAAIQALHAFRDFDAPRNVVEYEYMLNRLESIPMDVLCHGLRSAATATKSFHTLQPMLSHFGVGLPPESSYSDSYKTALAEWAIRTTPETNNQSVTTLVTLLRPHEKNRLRILMASLVPREDDLRQNHPALPTGRSHYFIAVVQRLFRGVIFFPQAAYVALRYRRSLSDGHSPSSAASVRND